MGCFPFTGSPVAPDPAELHEPAVDPELLALLDVDGGHQLLGIDDEGLVEVCKMLEYPVFGREEDGYQSTYDRDDHPEMEWVTNACGDGLVGYDLCCRIKEYLKKTGNEHESICTLLLKGPITRTWTDSNYNTHTETVDLRKHIGRANGFDSHVQAVAVRRTLECMREGTELYKDKLPAGTTKVFFWLDYTTLKQCQSDFQMPVLRKTIGTIGFTMAEFDNAPKRYLGRSFCTVEMFETINSGGTLCIYMNPLRASNIAAELEAEPIDARAATTRREEDKRQIDSFIEAMEGGFARLNAEITRAVTESAATILEKQRSATTLYLGKRVGLSVNDMALLGDFLLTDSCAATTDLDLSENDLGREGIEALLPGLSRSRIVTLDLGRCNLGPDGGAALAEGLLKGNTTLRSLSLDGNDLTKGSNMSGILKLAEALPHSQLTHLSLAGNALCGVVPGIAGTYTTTGINALCEALKSTTTLTSLNLDNNSLCYAGEMSGIIKLAEVLPKSQLTRLSLDGNYLAYGGDMSGVLKLAQALPKSQLRSLSLRANRIGPEGGAVLAEGLKGNTTLRSLDLLGNELRPMGGVALAEGLNGNTTLRSLDLRDCFLGSQGVAAIADGLKGNTTLRSLDLRANHLNKKAKKAITRAAGRRIKLSL